ncbi:MAG: VCBS repeat-containing protein [Acidobacteria bacterium]|nr:VCBS repeat-containing protein [Acidobacteriota bacterium]MBI3664488.1 VCBS repeat-containing protein [Acidobacteriota bacterium]
MVGAVVFPPASGGQSGRAKQEEPRASSVQESAAAATSAKQAQTLYKSAVEAEQAELWNTAFALYSEAVQLAPGNAEYVARRERAKFRLVQQHMDRAELEAVQGQLEEARSELRMALALDPGYRVALERLSQMEAQSSREMGRRSEYDAGVIQIKPRPAKHTFDYRGNTLGAYEEVAKQFGLTMAFDQDVGGKQFRFRVADVDFETAVSLLEQQTGTFIRVIDEKTFLVLPDTPDKRRQYAERITRTVELAASTSQEEMTEIRQMARDIAGIANPLLNTDTRQLVLRGEPQAVALAIELIRELDQARGEMMLEVEFLEVDRSRSQALGVTPPTSGRVFTLSPADVREAQQSTEALLRVIQRVFGTGGFGNLSQAELAARLASGQVGAASLLPPLIAFGGGKTIFLSTLPGAAAEFAETLSLVQRARRVLLRAEDGQPATFFVGDRFPISFAVLTPGITGGQIIPGIKKTDFATDLGPASIATGDFNGDGKPDLATANSASNTVSILLNTGSGDFGAKTDIPVGSQPRAVLARDFNGDGKLDLAVAVASSSSNTVEILLGTGTGSFTPTTTLIAGTTPVALVSADFNGDGVPDLAVANSGDNTVHVFLGTVNGNFSFNTALTTGVGPSGIAVADFNGDGRPDLAVTNSGDDTVSIFLGTGNGFFSTGVTLATGTDPVGIVTGDFDGGGKADIAVVNRGSNSVSVFLGNGDGTFAVKNDFATGAQPAALAVGDFTRDSRLDLAVANSGANTISILSGLGNGRFVTSDFTATAAPFAVAPADFDGDGRLDLVAANRNANNVTVFLNTTTVLPTSQAAQTPYPAMQFEDLGVKVRATPRLHANREVTLQLQFEIRSFAPERFNSIPVITNRTVEQTVRLRENEPTVLAGILQQGVDRSTSGWPGVGAIAGAGRVASKKQGLRRETELIVVITPRRIRLAQRKDRTIYAGRKDSGTTPGAATSERPPQ